VRRRRGKHETKSAWMHAAFRDDMKRYSWA
jgi:hypothetical protein